ncbi:twin-arginine translocation (Tat) [Bradyrhizobium sp. Ash2021]|uniref:twin-arginine translocation (Tat) n=1 Tax=Bradyrhizobium sp. Ash2021 TaxID=2954771 RepID=UPI00281699A8|nr:twin-arginine translocation (Tat) [Bradyrhizobium sp. Ash2021]WMT71818.1 twin-arginine translocation (Tat) [Bradyrhizobium sp. Ash2021]
MERRDFLKIALGVVAGAAAAAAAAQAAPLAPQPLGTDGRFSAHQDPHPAVTNESEVDRLQPQQVRWGHHGHGHHWGWHRRHWGWHHHRHWGWHHRWHRHHWHRRYW